MLRLSLCILLSVLISCEEQTDGTHSYPLIKDSAGVQIVDVFPADKDNVSLRRPYETQIPLSFQVSQYIRRIFEDSGGDLWFGTNDEGVYRFSQGKLQHYDHLLGFRGSAVRGFAEDKKQNLWIATSNGLCKIDRHNTNHPCFNSTCKHRPEIEKDFRDHATNISKLFYFYGAKEGLESQDLWSVLVDRNDEIWVGSDGGAYHMADSRFKIFDLPAADLSKHPNAYPAPRLINHILQDRVGNIWFASNGNGVYRYDWQNIENISEKEGLSNNFVQSILEDRNGALWFSTRFGGLSRYQERLFTTFRFHLNVPSGLSTNFIWHGMEDRDCEKPWGIWFATVGGGVYYFNGQEWIHYGKNEGLDNLFVQSIYRDRKGLLWAGCSGGLYRMEGRKFINVTKQGPWK